MHKFFKKPLKKEIAEFSTQILYIIEKNEIETNSFGIKDGNEIITEYLTQNELGLAYEHLEYIISEVEFRLTFEQIERMNLIAEKLKLKK